MAVAVSPERLHRVPALAATVSGGRGASAAYAPPPIGPRTVPRSALLRRLRESEAGGVVVACTPAGYGKTVLLAQWAGADPRRVAWLSLGPEHRDPEELASDLLGAVQHLAGRGRGRSPARAATALGRLRRALAEVREPALLVLDDAHLLTDVEGLHAVRMICVGLPGGSQVALGCRTEPALRLALLRARGLLLRLTPADLAMDVSEAATLLRAVGADLDPREVTALVERTEGWPAGIYLGGVAGAPAVGEFLEDEVLDGLAPDELDLLTRTAVLECLSPSACDAVLGSAGTGPLLAGLARRGVLVPTGASVRGTYRHHRLIGDALRARLARCRPDTVPALHRAASDWFARGGDADRAIGHAAAAGATARVGELVWEALPGELSMGRLTAVRRWLAPQPPDEIGFAPALAIAAAWCGLEGGGEAEHWIDAAERSGRRAADEHEGALAAAAVALLGAAAAREGAAHMCQDAAASRERWPQDSPWRAVCCAVEGVALDASGDRPGALDSLGEGARRAGPALPWVDLICRSWLGLIAVRDGAWDRAERLCEQAGAALVHEGLRDYASAALAHSLAALLLARAGRLEEARRRRTLAMRLLGVVPDLAPWRLVAGRVLLARASILIGDPVAAHGLLDEAREPLVLLGDAPAMLEDVALARESAGGPGPGARDRHTPLTAAETRVLRFLPTHHSFREIGEQLHISRFTVKSQALAVYRKLAVTSRGAAVARARVLGLLDDEPLR